MPDSEPKDEFELIEVENMSTVTQLFVPLAQVAWDISKEQSTRSELYTKIEARFDGETNTLFKSLIETSSKQRSNRNEFVSKTIEAIEIFQSITQSEIVHPQIYIPYYAELSSVGKIGIVNPIIIFRDGPPTIDELYKGFVFQNDDLYYVGKISEQYAMQNEVWVISVNERVNSEGILFSDFGEYVPSNGRTQSAEHPLITSVQIKGKSCMKEDWIGGGPEVWIQRHVEDPFAFPMTGKFIGDESKKFSAEVQKFSRKDVKNSVTKNPNYTYILDWFNDDNVMDFPRTTYVFFEYDPAPAGLHYVDYGQFNLYYRSYEGYFGSNWFMRSSTSWIGVTCFESNIF